MLPQSRTGWKRLVYLATAAAAVVVIAACGRSSPADSGEIPEQNDALVGLGAELYEAHCAACHGADLRGTDQGPSHLSSVYNPGHHSDDAFWLAVLQGSRQHHWRFGDMAPVPGLDRQDVEAIVAYVRERQRVEGFEPYPP